MRGQFKQTVMELAEQDDKVVVLLGDVSVYQFNQFKERWPTRFYNMGILEPTLISVSAGLAAQGFRPFVHTIAPFLTERGYEQIKLDLCYNRFPANIVTCGASFDYAWDGATHHAYADLAILRLLPGMEVMQPGSRREVDALLRSRYASGAPSYFRLSDHPHDIDTGPVSFGKGVVLKRAGAKAGAGAGVTVMTAGPILGSVLEAVSDLDVNLVYFHTLKPFDTELARSFADTRILAVHDAFGLREALGEVDGLRVWKHGLPDRFCDWYGTVHDIRRRIGLDPAGIRAAVASLIDAGAHADPQASG
jgi:transketolase